jgi:hypothetical protein
MNNELERMCKEFQILSRNLPGEMRKTTKNLSQDSRSLGQDSNPGLPENEAGVLPTRPRLSGRALKKKKTLRTRDMYS